MNSKIIVIGAGGCSSGSSGSFTSRLQNLGEQPPPDPN